LKNDSAGVENFNKENGKDNSRNLCIEPSLNTNTATALNQAP
jgi:hypothetical protein